MSPSTDSILRTVYDQSLLLWAWMGGTIYVVLISIAMVHALLNKKNIRSSIGWIGLIWFAPVVGIVLYYLFGINRIRRRARSRFEGQDELSPPRIDHSLERTELEDSIPQHRDYFVSLESLNRKVSGLPLLRGNSIVPLVGGDQTYERFIEAIDDAERSISFCTYIFAGQGIGKVIADRLVEAHNRGVEVRVIVDDVGARYSSPQVSGQLDRAGIPVERFMKTWLPWKFRYFNLRNHRKIMVVDGKRGFTGGVNVSRQYSSEDVSVPSRDIHFELNGPIVAHLQYTFAEDWYFCRNEELHGSKWFPDLKTEGTLLCRGISDGPDENSDRIRSVLLGALSTAEDSIKISSPYFLPDDELLSALTTASMKDVTVDILTPRKNNSRMVQWAAQESLAELANCGANVYLSHAPFDHSKLMVVDNFWAFIGSTNWDPRSLKLNFEFNVESYGESLATSLSDYVDSTKSNATQLKPGDLDNRHILSKIRDNAFRLFTPYL